MTQKEIESGLTANRLRYLLSYCPDTGVLTWENNTASVNRMGYVAGSIRSNGYINIRIDKTLFAAHRLVWLFHHGAWPTGEIDHINHIRTDNRIENLRIVSRKENCWNASMKNTNKTGVTGVCQFYGCKTPTWRAFINSGGKHKHLGLFKTKAGAIVARKNAEKKLGYHLNHGK